MSSPSLDQVQAALATVNDPEIKRPITDLGMVDTVEISESGVVTLTVLLTVAGCPLKETITRDVTTAVGKVPGVTDVTLTLGRDDRRAARRASRRCSAAARRSARSPSPSPAR